MMRFVLRHSLVYLEASLKMKAGLCTNEMGVLIYFSLKNEILDGHWPFRVGQCFDFTMINTQSISCVSCHKHIV